MTPRLTVRVRVAALLHTYTGGRDLVEVEVDAPLPGGASTVGLVMDEMDRRYPGFAFRVIDEQSRVRRHMNLFVGQDSARHRDDPVPPGAEVFLVGALSGG